MKILGYRISNNDMAAALTQSYKRGDGDKNTGHAYGWSAKTRASNYLV